MCHQRQILVLYYSLPRTPGAGSCRVESCAQSIYSWIKYVWTKTKSADQTLHLHTQLQQCERVFDVRDKQQEVVLSWHEHLASASSLSPHQHKKPGQLIYISCAIIYIYTTVTVTLTACSFAATNSMRTNSVKMMQKGQQTTTSIPLKFVTVSHLSFFGTCLCY